jgi:hypothetical protein
MGYMCPRSGEEVLCARQQCIGLLKQGQLFHMLEPASHDALLGGQPPSSARGWEVIAVVFEGSQNTGKVQTSHAVAPPLGL